MLATSGVHRQHCSNGRQDYTNSIYMVTGSHSMYVIRHTLSEITPTSYEGTTQVDVSCL